MQQTPLLLAAVPPKENNSGRLDSEVLKAVLSNFLIDDWFSNASKGKLVKIFFSPDCYLSEKCCHKVLWKNQKNFSHFWCASLRNQTNQLNYFSSLDHHLNERRILTREGSSFLETLTLLPVNMEISFRKTSQMIVVKFVESGARCIKRAATILISQHTSNRLSTWASQCRSCFEG